ncbi:uncharacterized protein MELLADRAFT_65717 [Melampsora larici-populina 98AG31]|uniref:Uncharacterized protein n=1 Tax=Melampsora larici-populina (strain 98AG31 / pathotype 3-4-7) TaxID=747676 RepID=F4RWG4_MELLP|nr:uncharacterized protein MELLADRAFT_65717 [Melampsora larici-populina 98AG31]EGG03326.1 hypothetical protein MELLADRAFT_65717 [Melampsora larici-populina 98AG31]
MGGWCWDGSLSEVDEQTTLYSAGNAKESQLFEFVTGAYTLKSIDSDFIRFVSESDQMDRLNTKKSNQILSTPSKRFYLAHIEKLAAACGVRSGNERSSPGCIPSENPSGVKSKTVQSIPLLPVPDQKSPYGEAPDVAKRDVELDKKIEFQRNEILRLKLQLLERKEVEIDISTCKPSPKAGFKQKPGPKKRGPKSLKSQEQNHKRPVEGVPQEALIEQLTTPALDPWPPKPNYDTLNRVLRLSRTLQSRGSSDDQLVIIEAFGQASISVLQTCRDSLVDNIRASSNCEDSTSPSKASRLTEGTLQWIAKVVKEMDEWVSRTGQEVEWKTWVEDVKYRIYRELYPILTSVLEVFMPRSQNMCGQISTTPDGGAESKPQKSVIELRESFASLFQTLLVYFEPEITISLASNVLTRLRSEVWSSPPEKPPIGAKPATFVSRHMGVSSETTASQLSRLRAKSMELGREESVIYLVNGLRSFCYAYSGAMIIPEQSNKTSNTQIDISFKHLDSYKVFSRCSAQLQELKQTAGETLESIWDLECRQINAEVIKTERKLALSESSKRDLVSVLEQLWVL